MVNLKPIFLTITMQQNSPQKSYELEWTTEEEKDLMRRILNLRDDQIASLLNLVGLNFSLSDIENVVKDIRENSERSAHLPILIHEANSKENLLWWLDYFERANLKSK